jgi:hypothetical protein
MALRSGIILWLAWACVRPGAIRQAVDSPEADPDSDVAPCGPIGLPCNPIVVDAFPTTDERDTTYAPETDVDVYPCSPDADESGGAFYYRIDVPEDGVLNAVVDDGDADIDLHLLTTTDADSCAVRADETLSWVVTRGAWYFAADTWTDDAGVPQAGAYSLTFDLVPLPSGDCAMQESDLKMFWEACALGIDCTDDGVDRWLHLPSVGPVVKEAHLVSVDDGFGSAWPESFTDGIDEHYALSQVETGFIMDRSEPWAPSGEGGSEYGQGSTGAKLPVEDEAWYVNMYWRDRPDKGTRVIVMNPLTGEAVVASGGYETGPGSNTSIGGVVEEAHQVLGSSHRTPLVIGFAADQSADLGPCP